MNTVMNFVIMAAEERYCGIMESEDSACFDE
jgi:hypothetical protein